MIAILLATCFLTFYCQGLGEWRLHEEILHLATGCIYAQTVSRFACRHFVLCKVASKTKRFDILVADFAVASFHTFTHHYILRTDLPCVADDADPAMNISSVLR